MKKIRVIFTISILLFCSDLIAQNVINGRVVDNANQPLPGVTVLEKGTTNGSLTDFNGRYTITVASESSVLIFSYVGFIDMEVVVGNQRTIDMQLSEKIERLDEIIVIGYGTARKSDLTGSVGSVKSDVIESFVTSSSPIASLQGRIAGVTVEYVSGDPGEDVNIRIRGVSSLTNSDPLYVIDGIVGGNINNINANEIASIEILKDASSAAIYGAAGGNGVVLVTTKSGGRNQAALVETRFNFGTNWIKEMPVLFANDYSRMINERFVIQGMEPPNWSIAAEEAGRGTQWQDEIFDLGFIQDYNFAVSGGGNKARYRIGAGYISEDGAMISSSSDKVTFNLRTDVDLEKWKYGLNLSAMKQIREFGLWGGQTGSKNAVFNSAMYNPMIQPDGKWFNSDAFYWETLQGGEFMQSIPPLWRLENMRGENERSQLNANAYIEFNPIEGLSIRNQFSYGFNNFRSHSFLPSYFFGNIGAHHKDYNEVIEGKNNGSYWNWDAFATYKKGIKGHNFKLMGGLNARMNENHNRTMRGINTPSNAVQVITAVSENLTVSGLETEITSQSFFGRFNYDFKRKYLFQATFRRDGTSRFAEGQKWGDFPSVGIGWKVSEEKFMKDLSDVITNFKVRGSWGRLGNSNITPYRYSNFVWPQLNYTIGDGQTKWTGTNVINFSVPDVHWETSEQIDAGFDLGLFNGAVNLEYSYFRKETKDLLIEFPLPVESGGFIQGNNPWMNSGEILNSGHEITLNYRSNGDFKYNVSLNMAFIDNEVLDMGKASNAIYGGIMQSGAGNTTIIRLGDQVGSFFLIPTDGLFNDQNEIDSYTHQGNLIQPQAVPGDIKFVDTNNDGTINDDDRKILGSPIPDIAGGFGFNASYKAFEFDMFWTYSLGNEIMSSALYRLTPNLGNNIANVTQNYWDNHWTPAHPERDDVRYPRNVQIDQNFNGRMSDRYMEDGSYLRLRSIQLAYNLPKNLLQKIGIKGCKVYVSAQNILTLTGYSGYDPDIGGGTLLDRGVDTGQGMPIPKTVLTGINLNF